MYNETIRYGCSAWAGKMSSGGPAEPCGCNGTRSTPLATSLFEILAMPTYQFRAFVSNSLSYS